MQPLPWLMGPPISHVCAVEPSSRSYPLAAASTSSFTGAIPAARAASTVATAAASARAASTVATAAASIAAADAAAVLGIHAVCECELSQRDGLWRRIRIARRRVLSRKRFEVAQAKPGASRGG